MAGVRQAAHHVEPGEDVCILVVEARFYRDIADGVLTGAKAAASGCVIRAVDGSF